MFNGDGFEKQLYWSQRRMQQTWSQTIRNHISERWDDEECIERRLVFCQESSLFMQKHQASGGDWLTQITFFITFTDLLEIRMTNPF